jgi:N,N-dimethylformamidase
MPGSASQAILAYWQPGKADDENGLGFVLMLDERGRLTLLLGSAGVPDVSVELEQPVPVRAWQFVAGSFDLSAARAAVHHWSKRRGWASAEATCAASAASMPACDLLIGAAFDAAGLPTSHFNGKIERPTVVGRRLGVGELTGWLENGPPMSAAIASWDFSREMDTTTAREMVHGLSGIMVNMPTRAMTGHNWTGEESNWRHAPDEYGAIHFHDDDLGDAQWETDFTYRVPDDLKSGVYAARLRAGTDEDHVPFIVRPEPGRPTARIAVILPTLTYLAYADEVIAPPHRVSRLSPEDEYVTEHHLVSQYNWHSDGSGVAMASLKRPLMNLRPRYRYWLNDCAHALAMDLYLLDWLEQYEFQYDVLTDHDLHTEGSELLGDYRAVLTGGHPEYVTGRMLEATSAYVTAGGRFMYLGGNGFYWVTGIHPASSEVSEIRRDGAGWAGLWGVEPGELYLATTGEQGGLWSNRSLRPQSLTGVEMVFQTFAKGHPYHVEPGGRTPEMAFVFEGVDIASPIGDFSLILGGAAGLEIDAVDYARGTPAECVVLARATGFNPEFHEAHADMTFLPNDQGGAVFSVSSMAWLGALSHNGYENEVSQITRNVLEAFLADGPPRWST